MLGTIEYRLGSPRTDQNAGAIRLANQQEALRSGWEAESSTQSLSETCQRRLENMMYPLLLIANLAAMATVSKCKQGKASPLSDDCHHRPVKRRSMEAVVLTRDQTSSMIEGKIVQV